MRHIPILACLLAAGSVLSAGAERIQEASFRARVEGTLSEAETAGRLRSVLLVAVLCGLGAAAGGFRRLRRRAPLKVATGTSQPEPGCSNALARQRLEAVGMMAGEIAHDLNNLLAVIVAESEQVECDLPAESEAHESIARIAATARDASGIVRELLVCAGKEAPAFEPVKISDMVSEALRLLHGAISPHAIVKVSLHGKLPVVRGSPAQLTQIVLNLVSNASEALGGSPGVITVSTGLPSGSQLAEAFPAGRLPGDCVRLEVQDTGCGMEPEVLSRIFEPYFSTKRNGHGLGLAAVREIVQRHSGVIQVESLPGRGTAVAVLLPAAKESSLAAPQTQSVHS